MEIRDWAAVAALVVSVIALGFSGLSLFLHWRRHVRDTEDRQPEIMAEAGPHELGGHWRALKLSVRNLDRYSLTVEGVSVLWPFGARLAFERDTQEPTVGEPWIFRRRVPAKQSRTLSLNVRLKPAGAAPERVAAHLVIGDSHSLDLVVWSRPRSAHSLKLRIRQSSSSTSFKVRNRIISARLPAATPTNSAVTESVQ